MSHILNLIASMYDSPSDHAKQNNITQLIVHCSLVEQVGVAKQGYIELHSQKSIKKLTSSASFLGSVKQVLKNICINVGMRWLVILIY